jgi:protein-S-isoprenylcysteine O-methyltransferase Ste14
MNPKINKSGIKLVNSKSSTVKNKFLKIYLVVALFFIVLLIMPPIPIFSFLAPLIFVWAFILIVSVILIWNVSEVLKNKKNTKQIESRPPKPRSLFAFTLKTILICVLVLFFGLLALMVYGVFNFNGVSS